MTEIRNSAVVYKSNLMQIKKLQIKDPQLAGELAIATIEMALTGETTTDNLMIELMLEQFKAQSDKNADRFDRAVESKRQNTIDKQHLREIAELFNRGYKQVEIAKKLGLSTSTVSDRIKKIRKDFPELLSGYMQKSGSENPDLGEEAENPEISKNPDEGGFELDNGNPGCNENPENSDGSGKKADNLSESDPESDGKSGYSPDLIRSTLFNF